MSGPARDDEVDGRRRSFRVLGLAVAIGGLAAVVGALLPWASLVVRGEFFEERFDEHFTARGISHWTGVVGLLGGVAVLLAGTGAILRRKSVRALGMVAVLGSLAAFVAGVGGLIQTRQIIDTDPGARELVRDFGFLGDTPVEDFVANWERAVRMAERQAGGPVRPPVLVETRPGLGPSVTLGGGIVAAFGMAIAARWASTR